MHKKWTIFLLLLLSLFMGGCGRGKKHSGYLVGIDPHWYPVELAGQEKNVLAFSIDLLVEIAKIKHLEFSIVNMSSNNLLWGLKNRHYDAALSSLQPYTIYEKIYSFSNPYLMTGPTIVALIQDPITNISDLKGKEIGVVYGSSATLLLQKYPGVILRSYDSIPFALEALEKEEVDLAVLHILIAQNYVRDLYANKLKISLHPLGTEALRLVALDNENKELINSFNEGLETLVREGKYQQLMDKWGLSPTSKPVAHLDEKLQTLLNIQTL